MKVVISLILCATFVLTLGGCTKTPVDNADGTPPTSTVTPEDGTAVDVSKGDITVTRKGVYTLFGTKTDGAITVNAPKQDVVLVLNGVTVEHQNGPAIHVKAANSVTLTLAVDTVNTLSDGSQYSLTDGDAKVDAAVFSRGDVIVNGEGTLTVNGNYAHGIVSKDTVTVSSGTVKITSKADAVQANDSILVSGGQLQIVSTDDGLHSDGSIAVVGGIHTISAGDDGVHAETDLTVTGDGTMLTVTTSYEALEATSVGISGGILSLTATDDGINAAGGTDNSGQGGRPGDHFAASTGKVEILGGEVYIKVAGDAIDANGTLAISGGNIVISGAVRGDTAILDFDSTGEITGGTFIGTGAMGMAQNFSSTSTQGAYMLSASGQEGTVITLTDQDGTTLLTRTADQVFSCIIVSHPLMKQGETYTLHVGDTAYTLEMTSTVVGGGGHGFGGGFGGGGRPSNSVPSGGNYFPNGAPQNGIQPRTYA